MSEPTQPDQGQALNAGVCDRRIRVAETISDARKLISMPASAITSSEGGWPWHCGQMEVMIRVLAHDAEDMLAGSL